MVASFVEDHVFDLPQIYQRPDAHVLLDVLSQLACGPRSWSTKQKNDCQGANHAHSSFRAPESQITQYLTAVVSSPLKWIHDDDLKEQIWTAASARLTERSGRTAMSAIDRSFEVQTVKSDEPVVSIRLHEPALTSDNLGLKTWASSFMLAQRFHGMNLSICAADQGSILELGAGTGLVGIAAAIVLSATVLLTDLPEIVPNLKKNIESNASTIRRHGGRALAGVLDWSEPNGLQFLNASPENEAITRASSFSVIVAADSIYSSSQPAMFVQTVRRWLSPCTDARLILEMPRREGYAKELQSLHDQLVDAGLGIIGEAEEIGHDDWGNDIADESSLVHCWYSMWAWRNIP